jgi:hypothetical protein
MTKNECGEPIRRIVPLRLLVEERVQELTRAGLAAWSGRRLALLTPVARVRGRQTVADLLLEDRELST